MKQKSDPTCTLCPLDRMLNPKHTLLQKTLLISFLAHIVSLTFLYSDVLLAFKKDPPVPKTILVHSVRLTSHPEKRAVVANKTPEKKKELPAPKKEEPIAMQEEISSAPEPVHEESPPKPEVKRTTASKQTKPSVKKTTKPTQQVTTHPQKTTKKASTSTQKQANTKKNQEIARNVQSLLSKAKQQRGASSSSKKSSSSALVGHVSDLSFEGEASQIDTEGDFEATPEEEYISNLIRLIQISVTLPDKDPVSLKLELSSSGLVKSLVILSCKSQRNKQAVEKGLSTLRFPSFQRAYKGESAHAFSFKFTREMEWVSF